MSAPTRRRIVLVAIDASPESLAAVEMAARFAASLNAELRGMFVEDIDLLRAAELPFASVVSFGTATPLDLSSIERELRRREAAAQRATAMAGDRLQVEWSFHVVRGAVVREILKAAAEAELTIAGRAGWTVRKSVRLGTVSRSLLEQSPSSVFLAERSASEGPLAVLYDGSPASRRALEFAAALVRERTGLLFVLFDGVNPDETRHEAEALLAGFGVSARYRFLAGRSPGALAESLLKVGARTVIAPASPDTAELNLAALAERLSCSFLLVR
ncbi:MAG TPA: universal stress protein [Terriglobia bacterium]|nr:universal stress protein [Terriglobia bacterium]